jgi:2-methylcitrate dehydratase
MTFQRDLAWQQINLANRATVAHQFARYALTLNYSLLPDDVVHQAKRCVLDALGCAIGAYEAPGRQIVEDTAKELGGPPEATCFYSGMRTSAANASLVNSFLIRFLDFNDCGGGGHNSDGIASILAVAEREKASGRDFLTSLVISYELGARVRRSIPVSLEAKGWTTDIRAGLNQSPALGKLLGLNEEQIANAIGICCSHTLPLGILDAHREENVMAKNLRFGWAAHDAMISCMLAKKGFTGPVRIVESPDEGIARVIAQDQMDFEKLTDFSGWEILKVWFKAVAANGTSHAHLLSTLAIVKEQDLKPEDIAAVNITTTTRESKHTTTPPKKYPRNAESADHSLFYGNALAIKERAFFGPDTVIPEKFTDPVVLDLIERITVKADPSYTKFMGGSEIITRDGRRFKKHIDVPHGTIEDPLTDKELEEKFSDMASKYMSREKIRQMVEMCWNVEKLENLSTLTKMMIVAK